MPKLPRHETKHSAIPATSEGVINGNTTVRRIVNRPAPAARAASINSRGSARRPARIVRNTSGAYCTPYSRMMPAAEYRGFLVPIGGAMPSILSSALDGPKSCSQASATTWGAIISGSTKKKTKVFRPRMSVSPTTIATVTPIATDSTVPPSAVTRLCCMAIHVVGLERTRVTAVVEMNPFGAIPSMTRRARGNTESAATMMTRIHSKPVPARRSRSRAPSRMRSILRVPSLTR